MEFLTMEKEDAVRRSRFRMGARMSTGDYQFNQL